MQGGFLGILGEFRVVFKRRLWIFLVIEIVQVLFFFFGDVENEVWERGLGQGITFDLEFVREGVR